MTTKYTLVPLLPLENSTTSAPRFYPKPRTGPRQARVSLIIDLGTHDREASEEDIKKGVTKKPCKQVAIFVDLVKDVVDYGNGIGEKQYRHLLNGYLPNKGGLKGINLVQTPLNADRTEWGWHPNSVMTKLAVAGGVTERRDVSALLNMGLRVFIVEKPSADGSKMYTNIQGYLPPNQDDDTGLPETIAELMETPVIVTFETATAEQVKHLRRDIVRKITLAHNYQGSQIQKALEEAFGDELFSISPMALKGAAAPVEEKSKIEPAPLPVAMTKAAPKAAVVPPPPVESSFDEMDDPIPF